MTLDPLFDLTGEIRREAYRQQKRIKDERVAAALEWAAAHVDHAICNLRHLTFSYADAAACSIWTHGTIKTKVSAGELANVGTRSKPQLAATQRVVPLGAVLPTEKPSSLSNRDGESTDAICGDRSGPGDARESVHLGR